MEERKGNEKKNYADDNNDNRNGRKRNDDVVPLALNLLLHRLRNDHYRAIYDHSLLEIAFISLCMRTFGNWYEMKI